MTSSQNVCVNFLLPVVEIPGALTAAVLRATAVGRRWRQQQPPRLDGTVLPGKPIEPAIGNVAQAVEGTGELPRHRGYRIGVVGQVGGEEHRVPEIAGAGDRPDSGLQRMHDIAA